MGYLSKSVPPSKMLARLLRIGLKVSSKSSEFLKDCRDQNFAFGLLCRFGLKRQCRLFLFRGHIINIYKYAYLCNFSHKCSNFGFLRDFFSRNCEFYAIFRIKCADFRFILENVYTSVFASIRSYTLVYARRGCIRSFLLNARSNNAIALQLLGSFTAIA